MASETRGRVDKNVQRRQINVMRKADGVYLMDHSIMSAVVFMKGNNLCIYENKDDWLLPALQNGKLRVTRTFPEKIRLAHIHAAAKKEEENAQARAPQSLDLDLGMDQLLPTVPEESPGSLFVPTTMLEIPRPPTSFGRPQLRSGTTSARPRSTPGKRNYFDTESEGEA